MSFGHLSNLPPGCSDADIELAQGVCISCGEDIDDYGYCRCDSYNSYDYEEGDCPSHLESCDVDGYCNFCGSH